MRRGFVRFANAVHERIQTIWKGIREKIFWKSHFLMWSYGFFRAPCPQSGTWASHISMRNGVQRMCRRFEGTIFRSGKMTELAHVRKKLISVRWRGLQMLFKARHWNYNLQFSLFGEKSISFPLIVEVLLTLLLLFSIFHWSVLSLWAQSYLQSFVLVDETPSHKQDLPHQY